MDKENRYIYSNSLAVKEILFQPLHLSKIIIELLSEKQKVYFLFHQIVSGKKEATGGVSDSFGQFWLERRPTSESLRPRFYNPVSHVFIIEYMMMNLSHLFMIEYKTMI